LELEFELNSQFFCPRSGDVQEKEMPLEDRINLRLKKFGLRKSWLMEQLGMSPATFWRKTGGKTPLTYEEMMTLSQALDCSPSYLMGETEDSSPLAKQERFVFRMESSGPFSRNETVSKFVKIPILSPLTPVCSDDGRCLQYSVKDIETWLTFPEEITGPIDPENRPVGVWVQGDGMEGAGILSGSMAIVNPAVKPYDGDPVLVCYGTHRDSAIKWIYFRKDGSLELKSSNPRFEPRVFTQEEQSQGLCFVIGKIMGIYNKPARGF
jgi:transcriptional regulator with XRE-family HTH domain